MKTKINKLENDWKDAKNKCRTTVNKDHTDNEPSSEFKTNLLISEHSPARLIKVNWMWNGIKSWISTHWSRHKWECFISTRRSDRIGFDRSTLSQDEPVVFEGEANAQHLIDTWRKRLCFQASEETRDYAVDFKQELKQFESELADVLVPNCVYRCGCPEFEHCPFWKSFSKDMSKEDLIDIRKRYIAYNNMFYKNREKEESNE
jgi:hypothetical protein